MIRAYHYLKVDWLRCKSQLKVLMLMTLFAIFATFDNNNTFFGSTYLVFAAVILSTQPFALEEMSESGFINMLPGTKREKVIGRYLFALLLLGIASGISVIIMILYHSRYSGFSVYEMPSYIAMLGVALIICSLQTIFFYIIGKGKSQQFGVIIRMMPGFCVFFGSSFLIKYISDHKEINITWLTSHAMLVSSMLLLLGGITFIVGILVSSAIVKKKDFD